MLIFLILVCLLATTPCFQGVKGVSQTFELGQGVYSGVADFDLQVGDRVEGSFSISNLGPYERLFGSGTSYEVVDVWFVDPSGQTILNYSATVRNFFNFTAQTWGLYRMWAFSGALDYLKNAKNPEMTLDYKIINATVSEGANPDMLAWWKLNEGNGTVVYDSSLHNRQGDIHGANWISVNGNNFLDFNGASDYVSFAPLPLSSLDAFSVSAWVNSNFANPGFIIYNGYRGEFELGNGDMSSGAQNKAKNSNYASFSVKLSDYQWYSVSSSPMKTNAWHHIVGVWTKGNALKFYVDGVLAGENDTIPAFGLYA